MLSWTMSLVTLRVAQALLPVLLKKHLDSSAKHGCKRNTLHRQKYLCYFGPR